MRATSIALALLAAAALFAGCGGGAAPKSPAAETFPAVTFSDEAARAGLDFRHTFGDGEMSSILESTGAGAAIFDFDGDGLMDIYLVSGTWLPGISDEKEKPRRPATGKLYRNRGDGAFEDVTKKAGLGAPRYGMGCAVGDVNNDGRPDLYLANYGPNALYLNRGDGSFEDGTAASGAAGPAAINGFPKWSVCALFVDVDRDGLLDLAVGNYLAFDPSYRAYYAPQGFPGPQSYLGQHSLLYRNKGGGKFEDVTRSSGLFRPEGKCMGLSACDYDDSGAPHIYQANDAMEKYLFHNDGKGVFDERALQAGVAYNEGGELTASMHGAWGDVDGDGRMDLYVPDLTYGGLYVNLGEGRFADMGMKLGFAPLVGGFPGWGGAIFDYDNDGWNDIMQVNGGAHHLFGYQAILARNVQGARFADASLAAGEFFREKRCLRGAAFGDLNNDGAMDAVIQRIDPGEPPVLLVCRNRTKNHWITLQLEGAGRSNRDAIGAKVAVTAGGRTRRADVAVQQSYLSACDPRVHFGLGDADAVESVEITWPDGAKERLKELKVDAFHRVVQGQGARAIAPGEGARNEE